MQADRQLQETHLPAKARSCDPVPCSSTQYPRAAACSWHRVEAPSTPCLDCQYPPSDLGSGMGHQILTTCAGAVPFQTVINESLQDRLTVGSWRQGTEGGVIAQQPTTSKTAGCTKDIVQQAWRARNPAVQWVPPSSRDTSAAVGRIRTSTLSGALQPLKAYPRGKAQGACTPVRALPTGPQDPGYITRG
jgi:hypothetical protein